MHPILFTHLLPPLIWGQLRSFWKLSVYSCIHLAQSYFVISSQWVCSWKWTLMAVMLAGSAWKCVIMDFLFFFFNNRVKGQIPELHYLKLFLKKERERQLYEWEWGWCKVSSDNGLLLGRWGEWASQMDIDLQQLGCEEGVGRWVWTTLTAACLSMADFVFLVNLCLWHKDILFSTRI